MLEVSKNRDQGSFIIQRTAEHWLFLVPFTPKKFDFNFNFKKNIINLVVTGAHHKPNLAKFGY